MPLFLKLLIPFFVLILAIGASGAFFIVHGLSTRAQATLDQELAKDAVASQLVVRDRELYLVESANFASNIEGMAPALHARDVSAVNVLLRSVLALKTELALVVAVDERGDGILGYQRSHGDPVPQRRAPGEWSSYGFVRESIARGGEKEAGFVRRTDRDMLAIASPVCAGSTHCSATGAVVVGIDAQDIVEAAFLGAAERSSSRAGLTIFDLTGRRFASTGTATQRPTRALVERSGLPRRTTRVSGIDVETVYAPMIVHGVRLGTLAVTLPRAPVFSSVRGAALRLVLILLAAMAGIVGVGFLVSRRIVRRVRTLVDTNRELGRGALGTRAPSEGSDELGELARGVNLMAEQLQASYQTLELRVSERTAEVERLLRERTEFFAGLSHDLQTPLSIILHHASLMLDPSYKKDRRWNNDAGSAIKESGAQLQLLIDDILELARAEAGRLELSLEDLDLREVIGEARPTIQGLAHRSGLRSEIACPPDLPRVRADRVRVREIILNLVDNAVKYTPEGGDVSLTAAAHNGVVDVIVADTGVGIPSEAGARVFEPFYRVAGIEAQRGESSSGLGLSLVKRFVEAQGGTIRYESVPGAGTAFTFSLPTARSASV